MILQIGSTVRVGPTPEMPTLGIPCVGPTLGIPNVGPTVGVPSVGPAVGWNLAWELAGLAIPKPPRPSGNKHGSCGYPRVTN